MSAYYKRTQLIIAIDTLGMSIASLRSVSGKSEIIKAQRFDLPETIDWESPRLGKPLAAFLRENNWQSNSAMLSLAADCCLFRPVSLPPLPASSLASALAIQAEQQFAANNRSFAIDYTPVISTEHNKHTLLVATPDSLLHGIIKHLAAGGVKVSSALPNILALADQTPAASARTITLHITDRHADLLVHNNQQITSITSVTFTDECMISTISRELQQMVIMMPHHSEQPVIVRLYNDGDGDDQALQNMITKLNLRCDFQASPGEQPKSHSHSLSALARLVSHKQAFPLDFLHSRLTSTQPQRFGRKSRWAAIISAAIIIASISILWDITETTSNIAFMQQQLDEMQPDLEQAQEVIDRTVYARRWFSRQPRHLECQKTVAAAFGYDGRTWANSIAIRDDLTGLITGNASSERDVLDFLDRLNSHDEMQSVKLVYVRESAGRSNSVGFAIRFKYVTTRSES